MCIGAEFDRWANEGRDQEMADRHWHTAKHVLSAIDVERGDTILDLGTGSGYALRALSEVTPMATGLGIDASGEMIRNANRYTDVPDIYFIQADFGTIPLETNSVEQVFSMEAFYYSPNPHQTLLELFRVIKPDGRFHCAVNFFEESVHTHEWQAKIPVKMTLWDRKTYREAFKAAGFEVVEQRCIPDEDIEIPPAGDFPFEGWSTRADMIDRYRTWGTLLTIGEVNHPA